MATSYFNIKIVHMRSYIATLTIILGFIQYAKALPADTIKLYFNIGIAELKPADKSRIDSFIYLDKLPPGKKLGIIGYADYLGDENANIGLSEKRANNVKTYLESMGIRAEDIQLVMGKGEISRNMESKEGYAEDRRVDIVPGGFKDLPKPKPVPTPPPPPAKKIDITTVEANQTIRLNKIFFYPGSHKVREESYPELKLLYQTLKEHPTLKIQIEGHICCLTKDTYDGYDYDSQDFRLSENRAKEIYDFLVQRKIDPSRLSYKGFGKSRPLIADEKTPEDENMNRRVEIRVLSK